MQKSRLVVSASLTIALAAVWCASTQAGKPAPPPPPPPPGKIYYFAPGLAEMNGAGAGKTSLFTLPQNAISSTLVPSVGSYNGHRWWLAVRSGGLNNNNLFATKDGQSWIQLTATGVRDNGDGTETHVRFAQNNDKPAWSNDGLDQFCSVKAVRWVQDSTTGAYWDLQRVIYKLDVSALALEFMVAGVDDPLLFEGDAGVIPVVTTTATVERALGEHHWSPDGTMITFLNYYSNAEFGPDLWVADVSNGTVNADAPLQVLKLFDNGNTYGVEGPQWSPQAQRISFDCGGRIYTISPNASGLVNLTAGSQAYWSPDAQFLAYRSSTTKGTKTSYSVSRIPAAGGTIVDLTSDLNAATNKSVVGWSK